MIGLRGASRYLNQDFKESFILEWEALVHVYNSMKPDNVHVMVTFFCTAEEGRVVINVLANNGLK